MTRLKAMLSQARQPIATRDATRDNRVSDEVSHVAFPGFATRDSLQGMQGPMRGRLKSLCPPQLGAGIADMPDNLPGEPSVTAHKGPVVQLRLVLQQEDGASVEAILAIPKTRYDGLRVLELFEQHRMAGTTRVISVTEEPGP